MCKELIRKAIKIRGSQRALADAMGVKRKRVTYLLNHAKKISLEDALRIEYAN